MKPVLHTSPHLRAESVDGFVVRIEEFEELYFDDCYSQHADITQCAFYQLATSIKYTCIGVALDGTVFKIAIAIYDQQLNIHLRSCGC